VETGSRQAVLYSAADFDIFMVGYSSDFLRKDI
jgi:hypothetical protein